MSNELEGAEFLTQLLNTDDQELEDNYDSLIALFDMQLEVPELIASKVNYCRANNLTEDDLMEENRIALETIAADIQGYSPIKQKILTYIFGATIKINKSIIAQGLFLKAKLRIERLDPNVKMPEYAHDLGDSGLDIYLPEDVIIDGRSNTIVHTGLRVVVPLGYELQIRPRSGNSLKSEYLNLFIANSPGTIDANYRNEVGVLLRNLGDNPIAIIKGSRIAQMVMAPVVRAEIIEVESVDVFPTDRSNGFGSTGD